MCRKRSLKQQIEDKNKLTEEIAKSTADINDYIESIQKKKSDISTSLQISKIQIRI